MDDTAADPTRVAAELKVAVGRIHRRLRQSHASGELTLSESSVLARLDRGGDASPSTLAEEERVRPQAMASTLAGLEQRGYVRRTPDPADGRRVTMSLTTDGLAVINDRRSKTVRLIAGALADAFTPAELRELHRVLPLLDRLADKL